MRHQRLDVQAIDRAGGFRLASDGHLHCEVKVYLTPESFILAKEIDADPCRRFDQDELD